MFHFNANCLIKILLSVCECDGVLKNNIYKFDWRHLSEMSAKALNIITTICK